MKSHFLTTLISRLTRLEHEGPAARRRHRPNVPLHFSSHSFIGIRLDRGRSLPLHIFTQSQSATVYFFCTISYTVAVCDCVFLLYDFSHSRSLRLCSSSVRFLYTVAVCDCVFFLYDFLHSRSLRLCISSVRFLTQSQSATVYFFCTISYTVAVCDCVLLLYHFLFFFLLSTFLWLISRTWLDRFWPNLVTRTGWPSHLCHVTRLGSKVT